MCVGDVCLYIPNWDIVSVFESQSMCVVVCLYVMHDTGDVLTHTRLVPKIYGLLCILLLAKFAYLTRHQVHISIMI